MTGKTLKELNVKPGDVVRYIETGSVGTINNQMCWIGPESARQEVKSSTAPDWEIVSRASDAKPDTPDYNDGKWHIWAGRDGDKCPVNPDCRVDLQYWQGPGYTHDRAGTHDWQGPLMFRVTKPAPDVPREFWIVCGCVAHYSLQDAQRASADLHLADITHVREVMP